MNEIQTFRYLLGSLNRNLEIRRRMIEKERDESNKQAMIYDYNQSILDLRVIAKGMKDSKEKKK